MNTPPAQWEPYQNRVDARTAVIVKLTTETGSYYFGTMEIDWGATHVYGILTSMTGIEHSVDIVHREWARNEVNVTLSNAPYRKNDSGEWVRPSDDLGGATGKAATVYLLCGEGATGVGDCLVRFAGTVKEPPEYDADALRIVLVDDAIDLGMTIPTTRVSDYYSTAPDETKSQPIPIVYGKFKHDYYGDEVGLAAGIRVSPIGATTPKYIFSDHVLNAFTEIYYQESKFPDPSIYMNKTLNVNDSGRGTAQMSTSRGIILYVVPVGQNWLRYSFWNQSRPVDESKAWDKKVSTYAVIKDNNSDDGSDVTGEARFSFADDDALTDILTLVIKQMQSGYGFVSATYKIDEASSAVSGALTGYAGLYYNSNGSSDTKQNFGSLVFDGTIRNTTGVQTVAIADDKNQFYKLYVYISGPGLGDSTLNNLALAHLYELRLRIGYDREDPFEIYGALEGREFGAWIDDSSRSNSYNQGDLIEDPAFIVESLLRDELSLDNSDIDVASFDAAANASCQHRMQLTQVARIDHVIRQISEQATFAFCYGVLGKARMLNLKSMPSAVRTIPFSHIVGGSVKVSKWSNVANRFKIQYRYFPQLGEYKSEVTTNNASSFAL